MNGTEVREHLQALMGKRVIAFWVEAGDTVRVDKNGHIVRSVSTVEVKGEVCGWLIDNGEASVRIVGYGFVPAEYVMEEPKSLLWRLLKR